MPLIDPTALPTVIIVVGKGFGSFENICACGYQRSNLRQFRRSFITTLLASGLWGHCPLFLFFFLKYKRGKFRTKYPLGMKSETAPRRKETVWEVPTTHSRMQMLAPTPTKMTRMVLGGNSIQYKLDIKSPPVMKLNWIYVGLLIKRTKPF